MNPIAPARRMIHRSWQVKIPKLSPFTLSHQRKASGLQGLLKATPWSNPPETKGSQEEQKQQRNNASGLLKRLLEATPWKGSRTIGSKEQEEQEQKRAPAPTTPYAPQAGLKPGALIISKWEMRLLNEFGDAWQFGMTPLQKEDYAHRLMRRNKFIEQMRERYGDYWEDPSAAINAALLKNRGRALVNNNMWKTPDEVKIRHGELMAQQIARTWEKAEYWARCVVARDMKLSVDDPALPSDVVQEVMPRLIADMKIRSVKWTTQNEARAWRRWLRKKHEPHNLLRVQKEVQKLQLRIENRENRKLRNRHAKWKKLYSIVDDKPEIGLAKWKSSPMRFFKSNY